MQTHQIDSIDALTAKGENLTSRLYRQYLQYADGQSKNHLLWFSMVLMIHGVFFLASPAILILSFNAPIVVLAVTVLNFFINLIANMGGAGIRTTLTLFYLGLLINLGMIFFFVF